jgi:hypothetical protein
MLQAVHIYRKRPGTFFPTPNLYSKHTEAQLTSRSAAAAVNNYIPQQSMLHRVRYTELG